MTVHAVIAGPIDTDMVRDLELLKASPSRSPPASSNAARPRGRGDLPRPALRDAGRELAHACRSRLSSGGTRRSCVSGRAAEQRPSSIRRPAKPFRQDEGEMTRQLTIAESDPRRSGSTARERLLVREKEHTRLGDALAEQRRELPWVPVEKDYRFDTDDGPRTLPSSSTGARSCSSTTSCRAELPGRVPGELVDRRRCRRDRPHLRRPRRDRRARLAGAAREAAGVQAPDGLERPWVSAARTDFNFDLGFSQTEEQARATLATMDGGSCRRPVRSRRSSRTMPARRAATSPAT